MDIDCLCYTRGCDDNPGSMEVAQKDLAPGDVTIPGRTIFAGDCGRLGSDDPDPCLRRDLFTSVMTAVAVGVNGTVGSVTEVCTMGQQGLRDSSCPCDLSLLWSGGNHGCNTTCLRECGFTPAWGPYVHTQAPVVCDFGV